MTLWGFVIEDRNICSDGFVVIFFTSNLFLDSMVVLGEGEGKRGKGGREKGGQDSWQLFKPKPWKSYGQMIRTFLALGLGANTINFFYALITFWARMSVPNAPDLYAFVMIKSYPVLFVT